MKTFCRVVGVGMLLVAAAAAAEPSVRWKMGRPIVTYWAGPSMTDAVAQQMAEGGWNLVWCREQDLDTVQRHGLRGMLQDGLLTPDSLEDDGRRSQLDALIERVRRHPALYAYFLTDEPGAGAFEGWGRLVAHLRGRDPGRLAYINLFPTYASNEQLGTRGDTVTAYREHLRLFVEQVKPDLISYDHYHFTTQGDRGEYFLNLAMIREAALASRWPGFALASRKAATTRRRPLSAGASTRVFGTSTSDTRRWRIHGFCTTIAVPVRF